MKIATSSSAAQCAKEAIEDIVFEIKKSLREPHLILVYYTETHNGVTLRTELSAKYPNAKILGCSSCRGTMTEKGYVSGHSVAVWAVEDAMGAYGTAAAEFVASFDMTTQVRAVLRKAIVNSQRPGELPALIILHATTGHEEIILQAITDELGVNIPIIGGSAADNNVEGNWSIFNKQTYTRSGIAISVLYPTAQVSYSFHSGYTNTEFKAIATKIEGRKLLELDGRPAANVYAEWFEKINGLSLNSAHLFSQSTLFPLGRQAGDIHGVPYFSLSHLARFTASDGIEMFCNFTEGEEVHFMSGSSEMLVSRAARVVDSANESDCFINAPIGGIAIYCAGCMLHVEHALNDVASNMKESMRDAPFICPFTFGEQGQFIGGEIAHGNLMISAVLFHQIDF